MVLTCCNTPLFTFYFMRALSVRAYAFNFFVWCGSMPTEEEAKPETFSQTTTI